MAHNKYPLSTVPKAYAKNIFVPESTGSNSEIALGNPIMTMTIQKFCSPYENAMLCKSILSIKKGVR